MPDVLLAPGSIKSLTDCKVGAGGVKDVIEIDIGVGGQVYKVWPSIEPYEDGTDLIKIDQIKYTGNINDTTGVATSTGSTYPWVVGDSINTDKGESWETISWYVYPDINVAQIDYLYCNYFYQTKGHSDSKYQSGGTYYCSVGEDPAGNPMKDTHRVSYSATISTQYTFYWRIDMRSINSGILKLGCYITSGRRESGGSSGTVSGSTYLKHLYSYTEEPSFPSSTAYKTLGSSTMT